MVKVAVGNSIAIGVILKPQKLVQIIKLDPLVFDVRLSIQGEAMRGIQNCNDIRAVISVGDGLRERA